jgi:hypothetical protein
MKAQRKKSTKKSESTKLKSKKRKFMHFPSSHTGSPVPEPKDAWQGEK